MAAMKKTFTTYKGVAVYPHLNKPDYAFNADGVFSTKLRVPADQAEELIKTIQAVAQDEFGKAANTARMPFSTDEETGELVFLAKSKFKPKFMDSTGQMISEHSIPQVYGGSVIKMAGTVYPYNAGGSKGVSLQLGGVQVISLADPVGSFAFEAEDGGFVADDASNDNNNEGANAQAEREAHDF